MPSNRVFGLVWAVFLFAVGIAPMRHGHSPRVWAFWVSAAFLGATILYPDALNPLEAAWSRLGGRLHRVVTPLISGALFFLVFTPAGLIMWLLRRDALRLRGDPSASTYWMMRREGETRWGVF